MSVLPLVNDVHGVPPQRDSDDDHFYFASPNAEQASEADIDIRLW